MSPLLVPDPSRLMTSSSQDDRGPSPPDSAPPAGASPVEWEDRTVREDSPGGDCEAPARPPGDADEPDRTLVDASRDHPPPPAAGDGRSSTSGAGPVSDEDLDTVYTPPTGSVEDDHSVSLHLQPGAAEIEETIDRPPPVSREAPTLRRPSDFPSSPTDATLAGGSGASDPGGPQPFRDELKTIVEAPDASLASGGDGAFQGQTLGRFQVVRMLGQGAFGAVYLTRDPQLRRDVAVKVAKSGVVTTQADRDRFEREARAAARLRHPNIVPVYEYGQLGSTSYIAYQYVPGLTLKVQLRRKGNFSRRESAELISKLARALHYAHQQGIVHRDVKPDNILMDEQGEPHVADFGCARQEDAAAGALTVEGSLMGTPAYMSPEQATGYSHVADARSDIWSLGVIFEELMTGQRPFVGSVTEILRQIADGDVKPIRLRDPGIPADLETIWAKCLEHNPDNRFHDAAELADELDRWLRGEPILSRRISSWERLVRWARRYPAIASLIATVVGVFFLGALVSSIFGGLAWRARTAQLRAESLRVKAQAESVVNVDAAEAPLLLANLSDFREEVSGQLEGQLAADKLPESDRLRLQASLLILDPAHRLRHTISRELYQRLFDSPATEYPLLTLALEPSAQTFLEDLTARAVDVTASRAARLRALVAVARYQPQSDIWGSHGEDLVDLMLAEPQRWLPIWAGQSRPAKDSLEPYFRRVFLGSASEGETPPDAPSSNQRNERRGVAAATVLAQWLDDNPAEIMQLALRANPQQTAELTSLMRPRRDEFVRLLQQQPAPETGARQDPVAVQRVMLSMILGVEDASAELESLGPQQRAAWMERAVLSGLDPADVLARLIELADLPPEQAAGSAQETRALLLLSGDFPPEAAPPVVRQQWLPAVSRLFAEHPDSGVHSACRWLLSKWRMTDRLADLERPLRGAAPPKGRRWFIDQAGIEFAIVDPAVFVMGGAAGESPTATVDETQHQREVPRRFAISTVEVTRGQYQQFVLAGLQANRDVWFARSASTLDGIGKALALAQSGAWQQRLDLMATANRDNEQQLNLPMTRISWIQALMLCRWLSDVEGLPSGLPRVSELQALANQGGRIQLDPDLLDQPGYRLPTAAEWELACRAGAATATPFGDPALLPRYAWTLRETDTAQPVGQLKPNEYGLFDTLGNVSEWCLDWKLPYPKGPDPVMDALSPTMGVEREIRGGSYYDDLLDLRAARRFSAMPVFVGEHIGFRLARTVPEESP